MVLRDFLPDSQPRLSDLPSCEDWLARAALAGMPHACSALLTLLEEIEAHPPRHSAYVQILERLRYPVMHAEAEQTKGFAGKPLPLGSSEATPSFRRTACGRRCSGLTDASSPQR